MLLGLLRTMRPHQWVKNLFVLAPLVFAKELLDVPIALRATAAFFLFCLASSTVYVLNDLTDVEADRTHPVKKNRPIASGRVPEGVARYFAVGTATVALLGSFGLHPAFGATIVGYLSLNWAYSKKLKRIAYVDVMCIMAGFQLRVLGGAFAAQADPSVYLIVVTFLLATFLGFGKRMHELGQGEKAHKQRSVLRSYDERTLTVLLFITAALTVATYAVYTLDPHTREAFGTDYLVITTILPAFGVLRFLHLVRRKHSAESPTEDMLRDKPFLLNLLAWVIAVLLVIYLG